MSEIRYTLVLDNDAAKCIDGLQSAYGLRTRAAAFELAVRVLQWLTEQKLAGYEIGRFKDEMFTPLVMPREPKL